MWPWKTGGFTTEIEVRRFASMRPRRVALENIEASLRIIDDYMASMRPRRVALENQGVIEDAKEAVRKLQ